MINRFAHWLNNSSIKAKFWTLSSITSALTLLIASLAILAHQGWQYRDAALQDLHVTAEMINRTISAAVVFEDQQAAQRILATTEARPDVVFAEVRNMDGEPLARYQRPGHEALVNWLRSIEGHEVLSWRGLKAGHSVLAQNEVVGSLELHADLDSLYRQIGLFAGALLIGALVVFSLAFYVSYRISGMIADPLQRLSGLMNEVSEIGDYAVRTRISTHDEIGELARGFNRMIAQIEARDAALDQELTQRRKAEAALDRLAHYDSVTGLPNRHYFNERLKRVVRAPRSADSLRDAVLFIDLDNFKRINDTLGHAAGDELLHQVAQRLNAELRETDTLCRLGGDEFAIIAERIDQLDSVSRLCDRAIGAFSREFKLQQHSVHVTASIGISVYPDDAIDAATIVRHADTAMYYAKNGGKNDYAFFRAEMNDQAEREVAMESGLRRAIHENQFVLYYQPQVDARSGTVHCVEALIRWQHPDSGLMGPMTFIPHAESLGMMQEIGTLVLREACRQLRQWHDNGLAQLKVAVNIAADQLRRSDFADSVVAEIETQNLPPHALTLELTETMLMGGDVGTIAQLQRLRDLGIGVAIDDFGTGYSSMSYLKRYPVSLIKIDRSFVKDLPDDAEDAAIASAIMTMARSLGIPVCAEGVELDEQAEMLRTGGCDYFQGYFYSRPLPAEQVVAAIRQIEPAATGRSAQADAAGPVAGTGRGRPSESTAT